MMMWSTILLIMMRIRLSSLSLRLQVVNARKEVSVLKKCLCKKSDIKCSNKCGCQLKICANQKIILQEDNSNFQFQLNQTKETLSKVEREKAALMENLSNLICYHESQQDQLASTKASLEEQMKLKDDLASEIGCLRGD
ncbi:uncharacterized protein [Rutidosis leptorrhynchoides]|uniref:uncharacterized protein n=1 Tax=Rutidosis leptorrhynchoides TaxID=125765 RepID=UPI003A997FAC